MSVASIQVVKDGGIEQFDKYMPSHHWQRTKKQTVHYIHDSPFATDKQLEDQRLLMERNRNPQFFVPTKVDKVRSETIIAKIGASRPVAVKANVLNKIVREASGIHNYTIIPPTKVKDEKKKREKLEPETNPKMRPYAKEAKMKPVLCSFGHRPRSASRTFHPATMKFRLGHGEIVQGGNDVRKTGFGLPVSILAQVLKAPKIEKQKLVDDEDLDQTSNTVEGQGEGLQDLFFSADEHKEMFKPLNAARRAHTDSVDTGASGRSGLSSVHSEQGLEKPSWVSSQSPNVKTLSPNKLPRLEYPAEPISRDDRPTWDQAHHRIKRPSNYLFALRASTLTTGNKGLSLSDRLKRFTKMAVAETLPVIFCLEKQQTDKIIMSGVEHKVPKSVPLKGQDLFYDPNNVALGVIQHHRKLALKAEKAKWDAMAYQDTLKVIPQVNYYPTTRLAEIKGGGSVTESLGSFGRKGKYSESEVLEGQWENTESYMRMAMRAAKMGDTQALFDVNMRSHMGMSAVAPDDESSIDAIVFMQAAEDGDGDGDGEDVDDQGEGEEEGEEYEGEEYLQGLAVDAEYMPGFDDFSNPGTVPGTAGTLPSSAGTVDYS